MGFLPAGLKEENHIERPVRNILLIAILMTLVVFATLSPTLNGQFLAIVDFSVLLFMAVYAISAAALIRFAAQLRDVRHRRLTRLLGGIAIVYCLFVAVGSF